VKHGESEVLNFVPPIMRIRQGCGLNSYLFDVCTNAFLESINRKGTHAPLKGGIIILGLLTCK